MRLERLRIQRANETEEERFVRRERDKMAKLKRLVTETEEERSKRLERHRTAQKRRYWRIRLLRAAKVQQASLQQTELSNFVTESMEEDQNVHTGTLDFFIPFKKKVPLHNSLFSEEIPSESPTQTYTATIHAEINKETNFDVVYNLIHSICRKQHSLHSHQHKQLQFFDKPCKSPSSNYILSAVVWHKLNDRTLTPELPIHEEVPQHQIHKDLNAKSCKSKEKGIRKRRARKTSARPVKTAVETLKRLAKKVRPVETAAQRLERLAEQKKVAYIARYLAETEEERSMRMDRMRMRRAAETDEKRSMRLERIRLKHAAETAEERSIRLERTRRTQKLRYWRKKHLVADC